MGNQQTKESNADGQQGSSRRAGDAGSSAPSGAQSQDRSRRGSRGDLSFLGISSSSNRDRNRRREDAPFTHRETKAEREARKLARERETRAVEREKSMKEENVDGGYLVTLGTYTGTEDYNKTVVRQLLIERKMAPFWRGLNDWSDNWAEHQLVAAARGLDIPAADEIPDPDLLPRLPPKSESKANLQNLTVPMGPRTMSASSDISGSVPGSGAQSPGRSSPFKAGARAKALAAALSVGSRNASSTELAPREMQLPYDPFVNGQPIEVFLYKDATECPICFLTYPPYLNRTRCCDQPICTECFVQIKRADPHLPEHHPDGQARDPNEGLNPEDPPEMLISEPSSCPYCQQPELGVTYDAPPFRRGLVYSAPTSGMPSATPSQSSLHAPPPISPSQPGRRRGHSLSVNAPNVITTDRIRPDWKTKLDSARQHQARRAAAATALHTAAFLVNGDEERRSILRPGRFSRRNTGNNVSASASTDQVSRENDAPSLEPDAGTGGRDNRRRNRMEELEEMMLMEAMRLSLASEEERRRKEEKAIRKETKRREKEEKKAAKKQGSNPYGGASGAASGSSLSLSGFGRRRGNSAASHLRMEATVQSAAQASGSGASSPKATEGGDESKLRADEDPAGKGKAVDRGSSTEASPSDEAPSPFGTLPIPTGSSRGGSHLRQMSNASSLDSSAADSPAGSYGGQGFVGPDTGLSRSDRDDGENINEPMFNFSSIAEMVGVNLDDGTVQRREDDEHQAHGRPLSRVYEDSKDEAEAEHVEGQTVTAHPLSHGVTASTQSNQLPLPGLTITPETPMEPEGGATEDKRLGHSSISEHTTSITH